MDEKSPRVQPNRHRNVFTPARLQTAFDSQNCDENTEGGSVFLSFPLHRAFGVLWVHFGWSWNAAAGVILVKEPKWIRPGERKRAEDLSITSSMSVESATAVNAFENETL